MDYILAKQLKDAGFPQKELFGRYFVTELGKLWQIGAETQPYLESAYVPTLEELIEACGEEFLSLSFFREVSEDMKKVDKTWDASGLVEGMAFYASTPTEAVANLWLALNKN